MSYMYFDKRGVTPTDCCPTIAGFHRSQGRRDSELFHGCWTMRFGDGLYYVMVPSSRHKGVLPLDKAGRLVLRCNQKRAKCKGKCLLALTDEAMAAIKRNDYEWLRKNPHSMQVIPRKNSPPHFRTKLTVQTMTPLPRTLNKINMSVIYL